VGAIGLAGRWRGDHEPIPICRYSYGRRTPRHGAHLQGGELFTSAGVEIMLTLAQGSVAQAGMDRTR